MPRFKIVLWLMLGCAIAGCRRDDQIQTYRVSKETEPAMPMAPGMAMDTGMTAASPREIEWKIPSSWAEQPLSSMRVGSFLIKGANGQVADMSVVPLSGEAGGNLANINRWRGQINLSPISAADLSAQSETITPGSRKMLYIDFVSHDLLVNNQYKKRLMAAIYRREGRTWFFKMLGEDAAVLSAKPAFMQFLKSLKFNENN
jgi:hypothetical protein